MIDATSQNDSPFIARSGRQRIRERSVPRRFRSIPLPTSPLAEPARFVLAIAALE